MIKVGTIVGDRYEILEKIGVGGMAEVFKGKDHKLNRFVAVKVLKEEFRGNEGFVKKFKEEAQAAARLAHPNIVNVYDVGDENGIYYIVMELVEGITLKNYIERKGNLTIKEATSIAIQVCAGLEVAHNNNIVHRDIKPQNIIISREGKVKVTDFGIAKATTSQTTTANAMGSVHYASPEQARGGYVDGRSDIYSLGIVMYEMVTGRVPFDGDTTVAVALQHLQEEMVAPSAYAPELPISLEKIILKCTMKSPDRRYATIEDLLLDLKKALVSPNEDFVTIGSADDVEKTRVISPEEQEQIREGLAEGEEADEDELLEDEEDEEEDGPVNPKLDKAITIMGIAAAVIIIAIVIYIVGSFFGLFHFGTKKSDSDKDSKTQAEQVEMIDVMGMTEDEAVAALKKAGISYEIVYESSDDAEEGEVIKQSADEGDKVSTTEKVKITVCKEGDLEIPSVVGMNGDAAIQTLKDKGFKANRTFEYSSDVAEGQVISQTPTGVGKKGDTVTIVVSAGIQSVQVPSLTNKTQQEAANELASVGLQVGNVTTEYSDNYAAGRVIRQGITQGKTVDAGTSVDLVISDGKKPEYYSYSGSVSNTHEVPVSVVLKDAEGVAIASWDLQAKQSLNISAKDIATSSGTIEITGDGVSETKTVTFTKQ